MTKASQNNFALLAARQLGAKQLKDKRIGRLANPPDRDLGSLGLKATQASTIDKRFRILAYGGTAKFRNSLAAKLKMIEKADEKEAPLRGALSLMSVNALSWLGTLDRRSRQLRRERDGDVEYYTAPIIFKR